MSGYAPFDVGFICSEGNARFHSGAVGRSQLPAGSGPAAAQVAILTGRAGPNNQTETRARQLAGRAFPGNLTGAVSDLIVMPFTDIANVGATEFECNFSGDTGRFGMMLMRNGTGASQTGLWIERTLNSDGTFNAKRIPYIGMASSPVGNTLVGPNGLARVPKAFPPEGLVASVLARVPPRPAGRRPGFSGAGRWWKGSAVMDSTAWHSTSQPVLAVTILGSVRVLRGSTMPITGWPWSTSTAPTEPRSSCRASVPIGWPRMRRC